MSLLTVLVAVGIIVYVIGQQLAGSALSGKRVVVLPAVLTVIGIVTSAATSRTRVRDRMTSSGPRSRR